MLRRSVLLHLEVPERQIVDEPSGLVVHDDVDLDEICPGAERRRLLGRDRRSENSCKRRGDPDSATHRYWAVVMSATVRSSFFLSFRSSQAIRFPSFDQAGTSAAFAPFSSCFRPDSSTTVSGPPSRFAKTR